MEILEYYFWLKGFKSQTLFVFMLLFQGTLFTRL